MTTKLQEHYLPTDEALLTVTLHLLEKKDSKNNWCSASHFHPAALSLCPKGQLLAVLAVLLQSSGQFFVRQFISKSLLIERESLWLKHCIRRCEGWVRLLE